MLNVWSKVSREPTCAIYYLSLVLNLYHTIKDTSTTIRAGDYIRVWGNKRVQHPHPVQTPTGSHGKGGRTRPWSDSYCDTTELPIHHNPYPRLPHSPHVSRGIKAWQSATWNECGVLTDALICSIFWLSVVSSGLWGQGSNRIFKTDFVRRFST